MALTVRFSELEPSPAVAPPQIQSYGEVSGPDSPVLELTGQVTSSYALGSPSRISGCSCPQPLLTKPAQQLRYCGYTWRTFTTQNQEQEKPVGAWAHVWRWGRVWALEAILGLVARHGGACSGTRSTYLLSSPHRYGDRQGSVPGAQTNIHLWHLQQ